MEKLIERLSSYNILNNILPGVVFNFLCTRLCGLDLMNESMVSNLFVFYFIGMLISRLGSIIVEPICRKLKIIRYASYKDFIYASKEDEKILVLLESNNLYRSMTALCILLALTKLFLYLKESVHWFFIASDWIVLFCVFLLFLVSYRKQTKYIQERVGATKKG